MEPVAREELWGHPKGLYVLFFTEMWERFSYYGMRALLVLFLIAKVEDEGWGWDEADALALYGWYTMSVYVASIPGGLIADRWLGQKRAVMVGGLTLCAGHGILAIPTHEAFYIGLVLIVAGVGLLKPNISTMVGGLYASGDDRRDKGFTIFYIGINLGAFLSGVIVGTIGETVGWHYGFGLAGIGMALGQIVYVWGHRHLHGVGDPLPKDARTPGEKAIHTPLTTVEKDRLKVLVLSFLVVMVFWAAFEQAGGLMNIYTEQKVDRMLFGVEIPATVFQSLNPLFIMLFGIGVAGYWHRRKVRSKQASSLFKMAIGTMIMGFGFIFMVGAAAQVEATGSAGMYWLVLAYLLHTIGELCLSPVALSFITKLAPLKYASLMMGVYFAATGLASKVAGLVGEAASELGEYTVFFGILVITVAVGVLLLLQLSKLQPMTHGAEDEH